MFPPRSGDPDPGPSALPGDPPEADDGNAGTEPRRTTSGDLDAHMAQALKHANLGLPVGPSERFRLAKRVVYRASWPFLRHQVAFNQAVIESNRGLVDRITRLQETNRGLVERITRMQERIEQDLRDDLLDFADRSASQAHAEVSEHVAAARSMHADLVLELRTLQAQLGSMVTELRRDLSGDERPTRPEGQQDVAAIDGCAHESQK